MISSETDGASGTAYAVVTVDAADAAVIADTVEAVGAGDPACASEIQKRGLQTLLFITSPHKKHLYFYISLVLFYLKYSI